MTGGTRRRGTQNQGEVWSRKRGHRTGAPHPFEGALFLGSRVGLRSPQPGIKSSHRASWTVARPELFDERRGPQHEAGSKTLKQSPQSFFSPSCLQPCPAGPFLTQAIFLKPPAWGPQERPSLRNLPHQGLAQYPHELIQLSTPVSNTCPTLMLPHTGDFLLPAALLPTSEPSAMLALCMEGCQPTSHP